MEETVEVGLGRCDTTTRAEAESDYLSFWEGQAERLEWFTPWEKALEWSAPFARWFAGGTINASHNALDVHSFSPDRPAILWEGEDGHSRTITYGKLHSDVQKFANVLKSLGVRRGERVTICLPMVAELPVAMLACARIGAVHNVVFSGFSAASLRTRIQDSGSKLLVAADVGYRRGSEVALGRIADEAVRGLECMDVVALNRTGRDAPAGVLSWRELMNNADSNCPAEPLPSDHPLFMLYTSGTTGRPKGVLHGTGGYLTHVHSTFGWAFDIRDSDVYFCTADIGWVTGHSYAVYGPLMHGATSVMYEGAPDFPDASRTWSLVQKYGVTILYTTPTALRMSMRHGRDAPCYDLSTLRLLGTVGEPINPDVWRWYFDVIGRRQCPIVDTWWQTETGAMMASPLPGLETIPLKPGSCTRPIPGIDVAVLDGEGREVPPGTRGHLVVRRPWPGMLLTLWGDDERYAKSYWSAYPGFYHTGDYARIDSDGYLWMLGRADDVLKVAGHRIGTAELESCIVSHPDVSEAAVCGIPDEIKGEAIAAFVVLNRGTLGGSDAVVSGVASAVREGLGPIAVPAAIHVVSKLPKTRSGKIMRRLLKTLATKGGAGDTSTLEDDTAIGEIRSALDSGN